MSTPRLVARDVSKTFGSTTVLSQAELVVQPGEIHALIGQNGSGKSTLVKILTGYHTADPGASLAVDGQAISLPVQWRDVSAAGVSVVHQDLGLLDHLTVAENIGIGGYIHSKVTRKIDWAAQDEVARRVLGRLDVDIDPRTTVGSLTAMRRAEVAIARALRDQEPGSGLVILDEATRSLPRQELVRFHELLRRVVVDGTSILMVSHNLEEVLTLADRVTVLRDGRVAASALQTAGVTEADLARHMLGQTVNAVVRSPRTRSEEIAAGAVLRFDEDSKEIRLDVHRGEIVGITGLPGTGWERLPQVLGGAVQAAQGSLTTSRGVVDLTRSTVADCIAAGVALVPEKRIAEGLAVELTIRDNIAFPSLRRRGSAWHVGRQWQDTLAEESIDRLDIVTRSARTLVKELSGGNQQKVLLAKWLSVQPELLVLHEPTQAVDVGARADILRLILDTAGTGVGIVLTSVEPADLADVCDRVIVFGHGGTVTEIVTHDPDEILHAIYSEPTAAHPGTPGGNHE